MPSIPGFGKLVWGKGRKPCIGCGRGTSYEYLNPNGYRRPYCRKCFEEMKNFILIQRGEGPWKAQTWFFWVLIGLAILCALYLAYIALRSIL